MAAPSGSDPFASLTFPRPRLAVGLGDPDLEQALLPTLHAAGEFTIERCLTGRHLLARVHHGEITAILVASHLPQFDRQTLADLSRTRLPLVLLAPDPAAPRWAACTIALPLDASPAQVGDALGVAIRSEGPASRRPVRAADDRGGADPVERRVPETDATGEERAADTSETPPLQVIAVASGPGSPGRTTVALNVAAALGAVEPTILVDADLAGPSLAAHLDADPTRNLAMLAHATPQAPAEWDRALAQETQPLDPRSPTGAVLCGVPKPGMRPGMTPRFFDHVIGELRRRYPRVIVDVGADLLGADAALHRQALGLADLVLLVGTADLVGLHRLRTALGVCREQLGVPRERLAVVVNRHDRRLHHGHGEIEWALGCPLAALIPADHDALGRALVTQRPVVCLRRSRSGRALRGLAERVHQGRIAIPPEPTRGLPAPVVTIGPSARGRVGQRAQAECERQTLAAARGADTAAATTAGGAIGHAARGRRGRRRSR